MAKLVYGQRGRLRSDPDISYSHHEDGTIRLRDTEAGEGGGEEIGWVGRDAEGWYARYSGPREVGAPAPEAEDGTKERNCESAGRHDRLGDAVAAVVRRWKERIAAHDAYAEEVAAWMREQESAA